MKNIFNFNSEDSDDGLLDELLDMLFPDEDDRDAYENDI